MYAVRRKDGINKPFRVGERAYYGAHWLLEDALTPEHEFAAEHGALAIVTISAITDPALMPFPVEQPDFTEYQTAIDPADLLVMVKERDARIVQLESQTLQLEGAVHSHQAEIDAHKAEIAALQTALQEVKTSVETFPEPAPVAPAPITEPAAAATTVEAPVAETPASA